MLDVHPAHHAANTWRDFFIHIATICLGLLIAIGLEQTIEALHHHHQRIRLEEDMRAEAEQNIRIMDSDFAQQLPVLGWASSAMRVIRDTPARDGSVTVILPPAPPVAPIYASGSEEWSTTPSHSVWKIALANGQVALLPLDRAKVYDRLEREATGFLEVSDLGDVAQTDFRAILRTLKMNFEPGENLQLTTAQRDELVRAVNRSNQREYWIVMRLAMWKGASQALLHNVQKPEEILAYMNKEEAAIPNP